MRTGTIVAVGFLLVIISIAGVGLIVGSDLGDQEQSADVTPTETDTQTVARASEPEATQEGPETVNPTPEATQEVPETGYPTPESPEDSQTEPISLNQSRLVTAIEAELNEDRSFNSRYSTDTRTATQLSSMAEDHSQDMAEQQVLSHNVGNGTSQARYERNGLYDRCQFQVESYIQKADDNRLEVIGRVGLDNYAGGGSDSLEERLADGLVSNWEATPRYNERISYENADTIGVGVASTSNDEVYATVNFC
ncbi:CAP domain-containing protein [Haloarcula laminariae]|uniref:CAP domain-containing protein n=1 Tax=Haloarcula laminariae TaxID=2961577 RepID=UPI002405C452|nr:CAP domain-containing protein [Halomicroarcula sp. FL173]